MKTKDNIIFDENNRKSCLYIFCKGQNPRGGGWRAVQVKGLNNIDYIGNGTINDWTRYPGYHLILFCVCPVSGWKFEIQSDIRPTWYV